MGVWPFVVIVVLAPLALGGLLQLATGAISSVLGLAVLAWLGIAAAVKRIIEERRPPTGRHVRKP
jgi:hypothetical protein